MMKELSESFKPENSALFILAKSMTADKVLDGMKEYAGKGKVLQTSLNKNDEKTLRKALEKAS